MPPPPPESDQRESSGLRHQLRAILAADAVGYSRLMAVDDRGTVMLLDRARAVFRREVGAVGGRVIDTAGDSVLASFDSAGAALQAAVAVQSQLEPGLPFRIGLHLGDVIEKPDGSVYGDGVNVAARLQSLAEAGGILVSHAIHAIVAGRQIAAFDDLGEQTLKNVALPLRVWRVRTAHPSAPPGGMRFGPGSRFELQALERRLLVDGEPAVLGARAFDVLLALAAQPGTLVSKNQLMEQVWPDVVVEENNLSVQISALRKVLGTEVIATIPGRGYRFTARIGSEQSSPSPAAAAPAPAPGPAAAPTPSAAARTTDLVQPPHALLGRADDLAALGAMLEQHPLVSIVGAGGVGKTSIARAVIGQQAGLWRDGAHWIELAPLQEGSQLPFQIANSLGIDLGGAIRARDSLLGALTQTRALVALDNCEHLLEVVAALVRDALHLAPGIRWLVTSQEPLRVPMEAVYRLDTLAVPPSGSPVSEAMRYGAAALLARRAADADRRFALTDGNVDAAIDLCRQLDGLPLAIEMAASRVATLGLRGVQERLDQRLRLLAGARSAPPRHQTLRAALDWSHSLLSEHEQRVFRRLAPFVGGFTADLAQLVGCDSPSADDGLDDWAALEALSALVDKSLVQTTATDPPRYYLLESAREYARERLVDAGEAGDARARHAKAIAADFSSAAADANRMTDVEWLARYQPERDNVREALAWACQSDDADTLAVLVTALALVDYFVLGPSTVVDFDIPPGVLAMAAPLPRATAYMHLGWAQHLSGSRRRGALLSEQALHVFESLGDKAGVYRCLAQLVRLYPSSMGLEAKAAENLARFRIMDDGGIPERIRLFGATVGTMSGPLETGEQAWSALMAAALRCGFGVLAAACKINKTNYYLEAERFEDGVIEAQRFIDEGEMRPRARAFILGNQVKALVQLGRIDEAFETASRAVRALPDAIFRLGDALAMAAIKTGRPRDAAQLIGYIESEQEKRGLVPDPAEAKLQAAIGAQLSELMPAGEAEGLKRAGAMLSLPELFALAMLPAEPIGSVR